MVTLTPIDGEGEPIKLDPQEDTVPEAYSNRLNAGQKVADFFKKALGPASTVVSTAYHAGKAMPGGFLEGFGDEPIGIDPEKEKELYKMLGIPEGVKPLHIPIVGFSIADMAKGLDAVMRATNGTIRSVAEAAGVVGETAGQDQGMNERMKRDINSLGQISMLLAGAFHPAVPTRLGRGPGRFHDEPVGGLPRPQDFGHANDVMTGGDASATVSTKLEQAWKEQGIHPAELATDADRDPVVKQQLLSSDPTYQQVKPDWNNWASDSRRAITTRRLENGDVVPAPGEVASYLENFGREAGFKFQVGPPETIRGGQMQPMFQRIEFKDQDGFKVKTQAQVWMPDTPEYQMRQWIGLGRSEVLFHEVGHALDYFVLNRENGTTVASQLSPELRAEMTEANKRFAPKLWEMNPEYRSKPSELMADSIAAWLSNPEIRKDMPLFTAKYGAKLDKYREIAERNLPKKVDGEWQMPPHVEDAAAAGGGGAGGLPPVRDNPFEPPSAEPPINIPGLRDAQQAILDRVSVGESKPRRPYSLDRLYTDFVDKFFPIAKEVKESEARPDVAANDPYKLARLYAGWAGKADHMIERGTFDFHSYENNGPALKAILAPVKNDMDGFRAFVTAARAKELELRGIPTGLDPEAVQIVGQQGIAKYGKVMEKLVTYQNNVAAYLRDSGVLNDRAYEAMLEANRLFVPFHRVIQEEDFINRLGGGGSLQARNPIKAIEGSNRIIIDPIESIIKNTYLLTQMAEKNVVGVKLVDMLIEGRATEARDGRAPEVQRLPPPTDSASREVGFLRSEMGHNGGPAIDDLAGVLRDTARGENDGQIAIYRNGQREVYNVGVELADAMKGLNRETAGMLERLMGPFTSSLRAGAVLNPEFQIRHTLRDFTYAFVTTTKGVFTPLDMAKGFAGLITKDADFWNWMKGGGGQVSWIALDRAYMQESLAKLTDQSGLFTRSINTIIDPNASWLQKGGAILGMPFKPISKYVIHPLQVMTEFALSASHLGAYKKAIRRAENLPEGMSPTGQYVLAPGQTLADAIRTDSAGKQQIIEASWVSRDTSIDGQRIGAKMNAINAISAFANAKVQDTDTIVRLLKDHPVKGALTVTAGITVPSMVLWAMNHEDSRYKELPQWEKDIFWHIITDKWEPSTPQRAAVRPPDQVRMENGQVMVNNGTVFRWPKAFGAGIVFGSLPERLMENYIAGAPHAFKGFIHSLAEATVGDTIPNFLAPIIDQAQNRSGFSGRTIIPHNLERELPEYQYSPYTTETAKKLGQVIGAFPGIKDAKTDMESTQAGGMARAVSSPLLIENYVRGWGGTLGMHALQIADLGLRKAGVVADPPHAPGTLADVPVVRAFVSRYPSATTQSLSEFYEGAASARRYYDTFMAKAKEGDLEALQRVQTAGGAQMFARLDNYTKVLAEHTKLIHLIDKNPAIEPYEKRQQIDTLYYNMIRIGQAGNTILERLKKGPASDLQQP